MSEYSVGDEVLIWITGDVNSYRAKVTNFSAGGNPILQVLNSRTGEPDPSWDGFRLKDGDYLIRGRWGSDA